MYYKEGYSRDTIIKAFAELIEKQTPYDLELQMINHQGQEIWVRIIGKAQVDSKGEKVKTYGVFQDITEQKEREIELQESNERFRSAFRYSGVGMCLVSLEGNFLQVNQQMIDYFGYEEEELLKKQFQDITHPDDLERDQKYLKKAVDGDLDSYKMDKRYLRKDGSVFWAFLSVAVVRDTRQKPLYFISQVQDINDRKEYQQKLEEVNSDLVSLTEKLSAQNRSLHDFAHITSHNLRAPVANLMMLRDLYESKKDPEFRDQAFGMMSQSVQNLSETLDQLMEALVINSKQGLNMQDQDLIKHTEKVKRQLSQSIKELDAKIETDFEVETIRAQETYLESILLNLISNALRYRDSQRSPEISLRSYSDNDQVVLECEDNGLGIDLLRHGNKVFGLHKTFHENSDAKGVGLFMIKTQMEAMGGKVGVESEVGKGSRFILTFNPASSDE